MSNYTYVRAKADGSQKWEYFRFNLGNMKLESIKSHLRTVRGINGDVETMTEIKFEKEAGSE